MIRVRDVVSKPMFSGFRLISDESGLDNVVSGTGIFDWETPEILHSTFDTGEFVLTILDKIEEGRSEYTECIRILIELKVAAIAFKAVNVREIPKEIVDYANLFSIPLFVFSDTYFDDIIFTVKSELQNENLGDVTLGKIRKLLNTENRQRQIALISRINPLFRARCICVMISSDEGADSVYGCIRDVFDSRFGDSSLLVRTRSAVLAVITADDESGGMHDEAIEELICTGYTGISRWHDTKDLKTAIVESETACCEARMQKTEICLYSELGLTKLIYPVRNSQWVKEYFDSIHERLCSYDEEHGTDMVITAVTYAKTGGSIAQTAGALYQHENTVRYRISRIFEILGIDDDEDRYAQLAIYGKLYRIYENSEDERMI